MYDYSKVPPTNAAAAAVRNYVEEGIPPGHFLSAMFANDFVLAACCADSDNAAALRGWAVFLLGELPARPSAWGTKNAVSLWCHIGGRIGYEALGEDDRHRYHCAAARDYPSLWYGPPPPDGGECGFVPDDLHPE